MKTIIFAILSTALMANAQDTFKNPTFGRPYKYSCNLTLLNQKTGKEISLLRYAGPTIYNKSKISIESDGSSILTFGKVWLVEDLNIGAPHSRAMLPAVPQGVIAIRSNRFALENSAYVESTFVNFPNGFSNFTVSVNSDGELDPYSNGKKSSQYFGNDGSMELSQRCDNFVKENLNN